MRRVGENTITTTNPGSPHDTGGLAVGLIRIVNYLVRVVTLGYQVEILSGRT